MLTRRGGHQGDAARTELDGADCQAVLNRDYAPLRAGS
jgi:hypothetical protein